MTKLIFAAALVCNIAALTPAARKEHAAVTLKLFAAVIQRLDTPDGFAFRLDPNRVAIAEVREWVDKESKCCPFIDFAVDPGSDGGPITLRLGGGKGVKEFIATEFESVKQTGSGFDDRLDVVEREVIGVADAMPEEKYAFVPTQGEFKGVRSFAQQIKHLSAANYQLGARILGEDSPNGEHGEQAPANIVTKAAVIRYAKGSFAYLRRAAATIHTIPSPQLNALIDAIAHSSNHYGQMVEYLRMNGYVPPAN
jgi:uncharacterized damage-inducible protein DinB